jgi:hypothetical protein
MKLKQYEATLALLVTTLGENQVYIAAFGYPSGRACPHCSKEVFANAAVMEQLASAPGAGLAHDHCHEIARLKEDLAKAEAKPTLTLVELPNKPEAAGELLEATSVSA